MNISTQRTQQPTVMHTRKSDQKILPPSCKNRSRGIKAAACVSTLYRDGGGQECQDHLALGSGAADLSPFVRTRYLGHVARVEYVHVDVESCSPVPRHV